MCSFHSTVPFLVTFLLVLVPSGWAHSLLLSSPLRVHSWQCQGAWIGQIQSKVPSLSLALYKIQKPNTIKVAPIKQLFSRKLVLKGITKSFLHNPVSSLFPFSLLRKSQFNLTEMDIYSQTKKTFTLS